MDSKSFWYDYFQKTELGLQLTLHSEEKKQAEYLLPGIFHTWCKGNINNAKFLLASILRELLFENETDFLVSVSLGNRILPIDKNGFGDFRIGAKNLIKEAALQSEHPIKIIISLDLNSISVKFKSEFEGFTIGLIENIIHLIDPELMPSPKEFAESGKQIIKDQNDFNQTKHAIISNAWTSVFEQKIDWDKNYYSNGGDSIQAIRFLSKIKTTGWNGEFGELLSAQKISEWEIKPALNETENQDSELENSYPLSEMQQKIWNQSVASGKGIYHEQFLFELDKFPEVSEIRSAFSEIWNYFPQLRIKIEQSGNSWRQLKIYLQISEH